jgi:hypothetical protein
MVKKLKIVHSLLFLSYCTLDSQKLPKMKNSGQNRKLISMLDVNREIALPNCKFVLFHESKTIYVPS